MPQDMRFHDWTSKGHSETSCQCLMQSFLCFFVPVNCVMFCWIFQPLCYLLIHCGIYYTQVGDIGCGSHSCWIIIDWITPVLWCYSCYVVNPCYDVIPCYGVSLCHGVCICIHVYVCVYRCMYVYTCICIHVYVYVVYMYCMCMKYIHSTTLEWSAVKVACR